MCAAQATVWTPTHSYPPDLGFVKPPQLTVQPQSPNRSEEHRNRTPHNKNKKREDRGGSGFRDIHPPRVAHKYRPTHFPSLSIKTRAVSLSWGFSSCRSGKKTGRVKTNLLLLLPAGATRRQIFQRANEQLLSSKKNTTTIIIHIQTEYQAAIRFSEATKTTHT